MQEQPAYAKIDPEGLSWRRLALTSALLLLAAAAANLESETLTLTTSYPAPSGVYQSLMVTAQAILARDAATNGSRVGIGTNSPGSLLDVNGAAQLRGAPGGTGLYVNAGGNVGIGTLAPSQRLDVNGSIQTAGFIMPTGAANNYVLTSNASGGASWQQSSLWSSYVGECYTLSGTCKCYAGENFMLMDGRKVHISAGGGGWIMDCDVFYQGSPSVYAYCTNPSFNAATYSCFK